jgi:hypothetical protein
MTATAIAQALTRMSPTVCRTLSFWYLAIAHLGLFVRVVHRLTPIMNVDLARSALPFVN